VEVNVTDDKRERTRPPATNDRLYDFFSGDGLCRPSLHEAFVHMASVGAATGSTLPDGDGKLVRSGAVGVRGERSKAQRYRETAALLARLEPCHVRVLMLAYGPQDQVPELKLSFDPEARARVDGTSRDAAGRKQRAEDAQRQRLGAWRQVMPETRAARGAAVGGMSVASFLVRKASKDVLTAARVEAHGMVVEAWEAWRAVQPRRFRPSPRHDVPFGGEW
jgi:hypothetical protein